MRSALPSRLKIRLATSRVARLAHGGLIVALVSLVAIFYGIVHGIFHGKPRVWAVDEVPVAFWAWRTQSPGESDIRAAIEKAQAQVVFMRAGQIDYQDGKLRRIRPLAGSFPKGIKLHLVYNTTGAVLEQLESIDPQTLATEFARDFREESERARRDGANIRGLQLDIDFPTRLLSRYEQTLNALRKEIHPGTELSITGLPTWMESPVLTDVLKNVDFWVPQFYGAEIPSHSSQIIPITSPKSITYFVNKTREIDKPFYAGLAAYSVAMLYSASGSLISLRGDMNPALIASDPNLELTNQRSFDSAERRYAFRAKADGVTDGLNMHAGDVLVIDLPAAETLRIAARITRELAGKKLLGICVFRLPARDDPATLTVEQVTNALTDRSSDANIEVRITAGSQIDKPQFEPSVNPNSTNTHKLILECKNSGTTSPIVGSLIVDLSVPAGSFEAMKPQPGVSIQPMCVTGYTTGPQPCSERRATVLRLTGRFLSPGQTLTTNLVLNRALSGTTNASITMQTDTDQTYSVQREVSIEAGVR